MPWLSRRTYAVLQQSLEAHVREGAARETQAQQDRIVVQNARLAYESLVRGQEALHARVTAAEKKAAIAETAEAIYRTQLNEVKLERAALLAKLTGTDVHVATVETPMAMSPSGGAGVSFDDLGDTAAAAEGYKDMHDIPASKPAFPSLTEV